MAKYEIKDIIPHSEPMAIIDDILSVNVERGYIKTVVKVQPQKLMFDHEIGGVWVVAGLEFMSQTAACYYYFKNNNQKPKSVHLLGTRHYDSKIEMFADGKTYTCIAKEIYEDEILTSFECSIFDDSKECANAIINMQCEY